MEALPLQTAAAAPQQALASLPAAVAGSDHFLVGPARLFSASWIQRGEQAGLPRQSQKLLLGFWQLLEAVS